MTPGARTLLLAAASFEDRCVGALRSAISEGRTVDAIVLDYGPDATPGQEAHALRAENLDRFREICRENGGAVERISISPYAMGPLEELLQHFDTDHELVLVDVSCFTRPHVLAAASSLATAEFQWEVGYTSPQSYGDLNAPGGSGGWEDTLLLPLGPDPSLSREGVAIGILLVGHEAARSGIALDELEPATGLAVSTYVADRPDLYRRALAQHASLLSHLLALRMPGPEGEKVLPYFETGGWERVVINLSDTVTSVGTVAARPLKAAAALNAPIVLYPFGPKIVVFCFGQLLRLSYPDASWAMYPVPRTHPITYSDGIGSTQWFQGETLVKALDRSDID